MKNLTLPHSTSFTDSGPFVEFKDENIVIRYDFLDDEDVIHWTTITFGVVYGYKYIECEYLGDLDYTFGLVEVEGSPWLADMLRVWENGGKDPQGAFGSEPDKTRHFRLFFDDNGLHEIICKTLSIDEKS